MNLKHRTLSMFLSCAFVMAMAVPKLAHAVVLTPTGLSAGDQYQLIFVTSTTTDASSTDIAVYNTQVQAAANAAGIGTGSALGNLTWTAVASTSAVDAKVNAPVTKDVYNLFDQLVDTAAGFYDNTAPSVTNPVRYDENGTAVALSVRVATGTLLNGLKDNSAGGGGNPVGPYYLGSTTIRQGNPNSTGSGWLTDGLGTSGSGTFSLYALSQVLTVSAVPEPASLLLLGVGLAILGVPGRRRS